jgi:hypothetical protein
MSMNHELIEIMRFIDEQSAQLARAFLESNGIDSQVFGGGMSVIHPGLGIAQGVSLMVPADQCTEARKILAEYESGA